jgi:hypothetical protein
MSTFDGFEAALFGVTGAIFGDLATWTPSNGTLQQQARVFFKSPNDPISIGQNKFEYRPYDYSIEYYINQFQGLKESVDKGIIEEITVKDITLAIREVRTKFDGQTFIAFGELANG